MQIWEEEGKREEGSEKGREGKEKIGGVREVGEEDVDRPEPSHADRQILKYARDFKIAQRSSHRTTWT